MITIDHDTPLYDVDCETYDTIAYDYAAENYGADFAAEMLDIIEEDCLGKGSDWYLAADPHELYRMIDNIYWDYTDK